MLGDTIKSKWNAYVVTGKHLELEKDEGSVAVDNMLEYITKIDSIMTRLVSHAQSLTERSRKTSQSLHDFGQGFVSYGLAEGDALGQMLTKVGAVIDQLSVTAGDHASEEMQQLLEPLGEYSRSLESVKYSISVRSERRQQYVQELTQIDAHHIAYNKLLGQQGKEALATSKEKQIEESQAKADSYKLEFDLITVRLLKDFAAFQQRKCQEMKAILLGFVELQILYHRQSMATWEGVTPILANTDLTADAGKVWAEAAEAHATSQTHKQVSSFAPNPPQLPSNTSTINSASSSVGYNEIRSAGSSEEVARRPSFHNTTNNNANTATSVSTSTSAVAVAVAAECIIPIATESLTWCKQGAGAGGGTLESTGMEDIGEETSI